MGCNCKRFQPKGKNPKGKAPAKASVPLNRGAASQKWATGVKFKVPPAKKVAPKHVSPRVAAAHKEAAKALAKANANPCKCTPGKP